jgi:hypothetical protein
MRRDRLRARRKSERQEKARTARNRPEAKPKTPVKKLFTLPTLDLGLLEVPDLSVGEGSVGAFDPLQDAIAAVTSVLQTAYFLPNFDVQLPVLDGLGTEPKRAWAKALRGFADQLDPPSASEFPEPPGISIASTFDRATPPGTMRDQLTAFRTYPNNWDDEGAPAPDAAAVDHAEAVVDWAKQNGLTVAEVDADVMGGIAVFLASSPPGRSAWIACMNKGGDTAVLSEGSRGGDHFMFSLGDESANRVLRFLTGESGGATH